MINNEILKIAKYLTALDTSLNQNEYENQLNVIYGAIYEFGLSSPTMFDEIVSIEQERTSNCGSGITSRAMTPKSLVLEYSKIAFLVAQNSFEKNIVYAVAKPLKVIFDELVSSDVISSEEAKELKMIVSETELDFEYATGNHNISSLRMAQIIREAK